MHPAQEEYIPPSCEGRVSSVVELLWNLAGYNGMECSGPPMIANRGGQIEIDAENLGRAQGTDGVLMLVRSWINENTGKLVIKKST